MLLIRRIFIFVLLVPLSALAQVNVHELANRVDRHYNALQSLQAEFTESYRGAGISRTESGTLWLRRPGRMRWEYTSPHNKLFVSDGRTAWFYVPGEKQARKMPLKSLDDLRTPLAYLLGRTRLEKEFTGLSLAPDIAPSVPGNVILRGVPRNMSDRISSVVLEIATDGSFQRIVANEIDGSRTEFIFRNQKIDLPLSESKFKFSPPSGVEIIQADELGQ